MSIPLSRASLARPLGKAEPPIIAVHPDKSISEVFLQRVLEGETDFNGYLKLGALSGDPTSLLLHLEPADVTQCLLCTLQCSFHAVVEPDA
jgi:hypothetical protein